MGRHLFHLLAAVLAILIGTPLYAVSARFDLSGPKVEVRVTRDGKTLPIAAVPNLQVGDRIWLHPDLPPTQSVHYLLIAVFLRGTTNPPPDEWFTRIETWNKKVRAEGVYITVPREAQQVMLFLAPETGGDFSTLRSAVKGRPGVFVRASQDLAEAGFEQGRIERYLAAMRQVAPTDPKALAEHATLLSRTLNLKPNADCFKQPVDMQYTCLTQTGNQSLLDDGHGQTLAATLTNGPGSDLISQASYTQAFGAGVYSAYVGAVVDLVRLTSTLHTAQYQYIPAIAFPEGADLKLRLNTPPSFHNPKSVIVIGLPAVQAAVPPPLRPADPKFVTCLLKPSVVLPVEGAPLVFSTSFAHDMVLHINDTDPKNDLPLAADPFQGGLVISHTPSRRTLPADRESSPAKAKPAASPVTATDGPPPPPIPVIPRGSNQILGTITGFWGFDPFTGPTLLLQNTPGKDWKITTTENLIVGRENHVDLSSTGTACINTITLEGVSGREAKTIAKPAEKPNHVDVTLALKSVDPGTLHLSVKQFGDPAPAIVSAVSFSEPARLTGLELHAGDTFATLNGSGLGQVKQLTLANLTFTPAPDADVDSSTKSLRFDLPAGTAAPKLVAGDSLEASVTLKDGRTLSVYARVVQSRPSVTILSKNINLPPKSPIQLVNPDDLPVDRQITFSLKSERNFPRTGQIQIATADQSLHTDLSVNTGTLILQDPQTILATLDPLKSFGTSAFGPLQLRALSPQGVAGDWLPLATLIRVPNLKELHCVVDVTKSCTLTGSSLYLLDSISTDADFINSTDIPAGFVGASIAMPHPVNGTFYVRLRDDPESINPVTLPVIVDRPPSTARSSKPPAPVPADSVQPDTDPTASAPAPVLPTAPAAPAIPTPQTP